MPNILQKIVFLFWFKELKKMWRGKWSVFFTWCVPSMMTCMIIAVYLAGIPDTANEYEEYAFRDWKSQDTGDDSTTTDKLWYLATGFTDTELHEIIVSLYDGDTKQAEDQSMRYNNYSTMQDNLYKAGKTDLQADYTLVLTKDAHDFVTYDIQVQVGNMASSPFQPTTVPSFLRSWTKRMSNYGVFSMQTKLAESLSSVSFNTTLVRYPQSTAGDTNKARYTLSREGSWTKMGPPFWGISLIIVLVSTSRNMVRDRELRIRQSLQTMGIDGLSYRMVYVLRNIVLIGIASLPPLFIYQTLGLFYGSDLGVVFLVNILFIIQATSFSGVLSLFFTRSKVVSLVALVVYAGGVGLGMFAVQKGENEGGSLLVCFFPSSFLTVFITTIWELENTHDGLKWDSLYTRVNNYPSVGGAMWIALLSVVLYEVLTWYLEHIMPAVLGNSLPWNFPFVRQKTLSDEESGTYAAGAVLSARNIHKQFPAITAVKDVSLDIYPGEVLSLLGHNGAGKTCTISIITGSMPATSGSIYYAGKANNTEALQQVLGVCPQHDILFDALTTKDHLLLVGALKGVSINDLNAAAEKALEEVGVAMKKDAVAGSLSGGQKRKMSVAMAFLGNSRIVLLDEPTAGMDPASRRHIWELVEEKKKAGVGIILTTHFMDEADILGNRVAIMHAGLIKDCGTSLELKKKYGKGYSLIVAFSPSAELNDITALVKSSNSSANVMSVCGGEVMYQLADTPELPNLLDELTERSVELGIVSHGLSMTTLEEVFLRLETSSQAEDGVLRDNKDYSAADISRENAGYFTVLYALMYKRFCCAKKDLPTFMFIILFPFIFIFSGIIVRAIVNTTPDTPTSIPLGVKDYSTGMIFGTVDDTMETAVKNMFHPFPNDVFFTRGQDMAKMIEDQVTAVGFNVTELSSTNAKATMHYNATLRYAGMAAMHAWSFSTAKVNATGRVTDMPESAWQLKMAGDMVFVIAIATALSFIPSSYAAFVIREKVSGCRNLQYASGVSKLQYWVTTFAFDCILTFISMSLLTTVIAINIQGYELWCLYLSMLLYGVSVSWVAYLASVIFDDEGSAQVNISGWLIGLAFSFVIADLAVSASTGSGSSAAVLLPKIFASINPTYGAAKCAMLALNFMGSADYLKDEHGIDNLLDYNLMGIFHMILALQMLGCMIAVFLSEIPFKRWFVFAKLRTQRCTFGSVTTKLINGSSQEKFFGVIKEQSFVADGGDSNTSILVSGLGKTFNKGMVAVSELHLSIPVGCFGLLGANGAGKTTTIKMLTGEVAPTSGDATFRLNGDEYSILSNQKSINHHIGLCPQFDAILGEMTGEEMITFFARLKGISLDKVEDFVTLVGLTGQETRPCGTYSGGNKRKLSVALALMGAPEVIFLDEPSTGVDPKSRRVLWDVIKHVAKKRTVVLTTHSMEEVDALSSRIAIMKSGGLQCVGTPQEIRSALSRGYTIAVSVQNPDRLGMVIGSLQQSFPSLVPTETHGGHAKLTTRDATPSQLLRVMQNKADVLGISEYAISQTTLEEIFVSVVEEPAETEV
eukprot:TRINITY_DN17087_c0_g1_i1.p1 TRINITY_DN17087_c0_g1~~TRINITY_DN17087_c0_g1_i1.p1  ORF type:complete len:1544 (+),score=393.35 TRINITY_DN17087_c0_g1_i1:77-4708(+)